MKKIRLKKSVKIILFIICTVLIFLLIFGKFNDKKQVEKKQEIDLAEIVYQKLKDENIDKEFIVWIGNRYDNSLEKLNELLNDNEYKKEIWHEATGYSYIVLNDLYNKKYDDMDNIKIINSNNPSTLSFVGDVSLADNWHIAPKYDERGKGIRGILSDDMLKIMTESDLMVANSEFTVSNRGIPIANKLYTFKAKPERLKIYYEMGVDLVTLANNHVYDYGKDAFLDMLDAFDEYEIPHIGAGHNLDEAKEPYYFIINGYKIAFVSATRAEKFVLTPGATENSEGVFRCYDPTDMINLIKELRNENDYVISIIHFGKENSHELEEEQVSSARAYIDAGADAVIGHHAHTLQGVEIYNDKPIIYNLGNFLFNSLTTETALFKIVLNDNGTMEYFIVPALQKDYSTDVLSGEQKQKVIDDINSWSINAYIDENGKIHEK